MCYKSYCSVLHIVNAAYAGCVRFLLHVNIKEVKNLISLMIVYDLFIIFIVVHHNKFINLKQSSVNQYCNRPPYFYHSPIFIHCCQTPHEFTYFHFDFFATMQSNCHFSYCTYKVLPIENIHTSTIIYLRLSEQIGITNKQIWSCILFILCRIKWLVSFSYL